MKTLRAFLVGSALGALVGLILAPQRDTIAQAQLAEEQQRNPTAQREMRETPTTPTTAGAQAGRTTPATSMATEAQRQPAGVAATTEPQGTSAGRRYVGNLNTKIYHEATDTNLPNEENRAYFATPEEAEAAGYRPAQ